MNIEMNKIRGYSVYSSTNASRKLSVHSNTSYMDYMEKIQAQLNSNIQAEQIDKEIFQPQSLFYALVEERMSNTINTKLSNRNIHNPYINITTNT